MPHGQLNAARRRLSPSWPNSEVAENPDDFRFQGIPDVAEKARHVAF